MYVFNGYVSIRYIAVLGFQLEGDVSDRLLGEIVSIRYIAVLGFQREGCEIETEYGTKFQSAISRYLVSNKITEVIITSGLEKSFNPLYRGTWFPTLPEKHPL